MANQWTVNRGQWTEIGDQGSGIGGRLVSVAKRCGGVDPAGFLHQAQGQERLYWADSHNATIFAGFGATADLIAWGHDRFQQIEARARALFANAILPQNAPTLAAPRLFGGFSFRPDFTPDNTWAVFKPAHFILPHYQLLQDDNQTWLTLNALIPTDESPGELIPQLEAALSERIAALRTEDGRRKTESSAKYTLDYPMSFGEWERVIKQTVQQTKECELQKAVLSRVCEIRFGQRIDVDSVLDKLNTIYPMCYRFLFEPRPHHAFFGATPELLAHVTGRTLATVALAGSAPRGDTPAGDKLHAHNLLHSGKDRWEHQLVVDAIRHRLEPLSERFNANVQPHIYALPNIQHLQTSIYSTLKEPIGILPIVAHLHPTPALGGTPRQTALQLIQELEPVPRGWYAGPVGMIDHQLDGTFAVAIRSAVSQEKRVWLHAGAGIVSKSDAKKEWDETELKFRPILEALNLQ